MNKQIEEMARDFEDYACMSKFQAEIAAKAFCALGYRKASDVAREIFEEIEDALSVHAYTSKSEDYSDGAYDALEWVDAKIADLKKKYESEEQV